MNSLEFKRFKEIMESNLVRKKLLTYEESYKNQLLASLINFLLLTKDYDCAEEYLQKINTFTEVPLLPTWFLTEIKKLNNKEANDLMYHFFMNDGYLYHVTKKSHLDDVFQHGLVSLNKKFNENMYKQCLRINRSFRDIHLIDIPGYNQLYKKRFHSIYLSTNLAHALSVYGCSSEIFTLFLDNLLYILNIDESYKYLSKLELRNKIVSQLTQLSTEEKVLSNLINFYDQFYEPIDKNRIYNKMIVMVPRNHIRDTTCNDMISHTYNRLKKDKINFVYHYRNCCDIQSPYSIAPKTLIGITIDENSCLKVHTKKKSF